MIIHTRENDPIRPEIPKEMANRIYSAQKKVLSQRDRVMHAEDRIRDDSEELGFYERDPRGWADKRYGPQFTLDSYPVITRSTRIRDDLELRIERRPLRALDLRNAEQTLSTIEEEVLVRVRGMRPTSGRVPWPPVLPLFVGYDQILDTSDEAVARANAYMAKQTVIYAAQLKEFDDDGTILGDGSEEALGNRRSDWCRPNKLNRGILRIRKGSCFQVTAYSHDCINAMQRVIDEDHSNGFVGNLWNLACGFFLTGCDWIGFREWRENVIANVEHTSSYRALTSPGMSLETARLVAKARYARVLSALDGHYLPDLIDVQSFAFGSGVMPSDLYAFWKGVGFNEAIARNWFLKSQPHTRIFWAINNSFDKETWQAMRHTNLALEGSEIPLARGINAFNLRELRSAMEVLGMKPLRIVTECRSLLLDNPDPESVKAALEPSGYLQLQAVNPPPSLDWDEFQSWRMQFRAMSGVLTDLYLDDPQLRRAQRDILLQ